MNQPIGKSYKPWLIASLVVLVGSLVLLATVGAVAFLYFSQVTTPIWLTLVGALAVLGIVLGFGGFFLLMVIAGWASFKESRKVQVLPPE